MEGFYPADNLPPHQQQQQQQQQSLSQDQRSRDHHQMNHTLAPEHSIITSDSLDDIIRNNESELLRRRSMPQAYGNSMMTNQDSRRMSSMDTSNVLSFGNSNTDLSNYQFNQQIANPFPNINTSNLNMATQMPEVLGTSMADPGDYSTISSGMMRSMIPSDFANMEISQIPTNSPTMNLFSPAQPDVNAMGSQFTSSQLTAMPNGFDMSIKSGDASMGTTPSNGNSNLKSMEDAENDALDISSGQFNPIDAAVSRETNFNSLDPNIANFNHSMPAALPGRISSSASMISPQRAKQSTNIAQPSTSSTMTTPVTVSAPRQPREKTIYSKSGFDMLKALWLVATRKEPKIHLGAVDMSCAFVVCDVSMNDCPIIYVSDNFQNLTGYSRHEIVGQNCRFLQAPDGKVEAGSKREFVDDGAVYNLKKMIHEGREVQQSLINYRKGGKPFLNLLTMIPIPWDTEDIRYFIGFQIDLVECPDAIASSQELGGVKVNYKHSDIGQYIWTPPASSQWEPENGQTLGMDDVSTLLQQFNPKGLVSDWHKQSWDKMLLENTDDVVHVLSLKGLFLYVSPSCKRVLEYDPADVIGNSLSSVCHPSDIVPVTRELKDTTAGTQVNIVFRIRRKHSGYTWFESHGSLFVEQGKGRKCIILVGRKRPVFALGRRSLEANGGIGDSELWTKLSTSGMFLFVSSNIRSLLDLQPESLIGTSIQDLMRKESRPEFGRSIEAARRGKITSCKHEVQNRRGQGLQAQTTLYPGDASEGQKPSFLLAQTKLLKASSRSIAPANTGGHSKPVIVSAPRTDIHPQSNQQQMGTEQVSQPAGGALELGSQDAALASDDNIFDELRTTKCSSWQFELRQMEKVNRILAEELGGLLSNKKKRKRRKGVGNLARDCANCHTKNTPEWRRGPSGQRDLCNSCGLRWAKQTGRVSPRNSSRGGGHNGNGNGDSLSKKSASPIHSSPLHREISSDTPKHLVTMTGGEGTIPSGKCLGPGLSTQTPGAPATATNASIAMPPPSQPSRLAGGANSSAMTSIREERETSQS